MSRPRRHFGAAGLHGTRIATRAEVRLTLGNLGDGFHETVNFFFSAPPAGGDADDGWTRPLINVADRVALGIDRVRHILHCLAFDREADETGHAILRRRNG